jgi:hypothetical protein
MKYFITILLFCSCAFSNAQSLEALTGCERSEWIVYSAAYDFTDYQSYKWERIDTNRSQTWRYIGDNFGFYKKKRVMHLTKKIWNAGPLVSEGDRAQICSPIFEPDSNAYGSVYFKIRSFELNGVIPLSDFIFVTKISELPDLLDKPEESWILVDPELYKLIPIPADETEIIQKSPLEKYLEY